MDEMYNTLMRGLKKTDQRSEPKNQTDEAPVERDDEPGDRELPSIFIHSHDDGHTVHVFHPDGRKEDPQEYEKGDADGIAGQIKDLLS